MIHELATGFFVWDVLSWLLIFIVTAAIMCLLVYAASKRKAGRLMHVNSAFESRGMYSSQFEEFLMKLRQNCFEPWTSQPQSHLAMLAATLLLMLAAIFCGMRGV